MLLCYAVYFAVTLAANVGFGDFGCFNRSATGLPTEEVQPLKFLHYHHAVYVGKHVLFQILAVHGGDNGPVLDANHKSHIIY